ncbi:hypothetical protein LJR231_005678 [Phyllobacterium sp. LjRoot231]|uniref:hypothetical protein n=1 Tax=Phyllobacterium sp. LjRoot231 TaxID=3342289 RepID=UPI003ECCD22E
MSQLVTAMELAGVSYGLSKLVITPFRKAQSDKSKGFQHNVPRDVRSDDLSWPFLTRQLHPAQLIIAASGAMALPVSMVLVHGPIATNIVVNQLFQPPRFRFLHYWQ